MLYSFCNLIYNGLHLIHSVIGAKREAQGALCHVSAQAEGEQYVAGLK